MMARRSTYSGDWMPLLSLKSPNLTACLHSMREAKLTGNEPLQPARAHLNLVQAHAQLLNVLVCDGHCSLQAAEIHCRIT